MSGEGIVIITLDIFLNILLKTYFLYISRCWWLGTYIFKILWWNIGGISSGYPSSKTLGNFFNSLNPSLTKSFSYSSFIFTIEFWFKKTYFSQTIYVCFMEIYLPRLSCNSEIYTYSKILKTCFLGNISKLKHNSETCLSCGKLHYCCGKCSECLKDVFLLFVQNVVKNLKWTYSLVVSSLGNGSSLHLIKYGSLMVNYVKCMVNHATFSYITICKFAYALNSRRTAENN